MNLLKRRDVLKLLAAASGYPLAAKLSSAAQGKKRHVAADAPAQNARSHRNRAPKNRRPLAPNAFYILPLGRFALQGGCGARWRSRRMA